VIQIQVQIQTIDDLLIALLDALQDLLVCSAGGCCLIACIQHIGYFLILAVSLARCRRNDITAGLICPNDVSHFFELTRTRQRASAKLHYFFHDRLISS